MNWAHLFFGAILMLIGGDWLVRGTVGISRRLGLSEFIIAVVIIGIGTSTPELFVSIISDNRDLGTLVISNNISSNIVDIWGVIGIGAFLSPIILNGRKHLTDFIFLWVATAIMTIMCMFRVIGWVDGIILYSIFAAYLVYAIMNAKEKPAKIDGQDGLDGAVYKSGSRINYSPIFGNRVNTAIKGKKNLTIGYVSAIRQHYDFLYDNALFRFFQYSIPGLISLTLLGIGLVYFGSEIFMNALQIVSRMNHLDQTLAGILIVGPGTSMPELIVTIIAAIRRRPQIAIGNILGSNLMNIALVVPTAAIFMDLPVTKHISHLDVWAMVAALVMLTLNLFAWKRISRWTSVLYMSLLVVYMYWVVMWH
ncbi:MAG: sodium:calcium antiporter [Alphaproteobacteria bacterium]|nr:sodium:calcium antiporter [Alphaproteobacteria bacterium]